MEEWKSERAAQRRSQARVRVCCIATAQGSSRFRCPRIVRIRPIAIILQPFRDSHDCIRTPALVEPRHPGLDAAGRVRVHAARSLGSATGPSHLGAVLHGARTDEVRNRVAATDRPALHQPLASGHRRRSVRTACDAQARVRSAGEGALRVHAPWHPRCSAPYRVASTAARSSRFPGTGLNRCRA